VRNADGTTQETPLVAVDDAELDVEPYVQSLSTEDPGVIRAWDLVETYDGEASKLRIRTPGGNKAVRKYVS
jgi:hypothetical protein